MANFRKKLKSNRVRLLFGKDQDLLGEDIYLYTIQEVQTSIDQNYEPLLPSGGNTLLTLASAATGGKIPSGQFKQQGFQIWKGTSPMSLSLTCELQMNKSGLRDVMGPVATLQSFAVPGVNGSMLVPPGPSIFRAIEGYAQGGGLGSGLMQKLADAAKKAGLTKEKGTINVKIGEFLYLPDMVLEKISCTWSTSLDDEYYPIKCTLGLDFKGIEIASTELVARMYPSAYIGQVPLKDYSAVADNYQSSEDLKVENPDNAPLTN